MKNLKLVALVALVCTLFTVSCKDDDDNASSANNVMTIDGTQYTIELGVLEEFGENSDGSYDWDVSFLSDGFNINVGNETVTGIGSTLYLDLNTNSATGLVPGTYTYSNERAEFTWVFADAATNFNVDTEEGNYFDAVSGTVTISGTRNNQIIIIDMLDNNGNQITTNYRGALQSF